MQDKVTVKDIIIQMLASPEWQNQYNSFVDEYCIYFDEEEEHSVQQLNLHKNFQKEMAAVYDSFMSQLGVDNQDIESEVIKELLQEDQDNIDVDQLVALGDFEVFKAEMAYQNKVREIQALKQLQIDDEEQYDQIDILKLKLEYEQMEEEINLEIAVQMSLDAPDENKIQFLKEQLSKIEERLQQLQKDAEQVEQQDQNKQQQQQQQQQQQVQQQQQRIEKLKGQLDSLQAINVEKEKEIQEFLKNNNDFK